MVYDSVRKVTVAVGSTWDNVWEYNAALNTWIERTSASSPTPGRRDHMRLAFDATLGRTVIFGGCTMPLCALSDYQNDRWEWDGTCWRNTTNAQKQPPVLQTPGMVYDAARQKTLIFGGYNTANSTTSGVTYQ